MQRPAPTHRLTLIIAATAAVLAALPAAAQQPPAKKKPVPRAAPAPAAPALPPADAGQMAAAGMALYGAYACEFGKSLRLSANPKSEGYVDLQLDKQRVTLKPVLSSTGALRLEDVHGRLLLVQIATKSMVMDVKVGQRLVDDCVHETQAETRRRLAAAPPGPGLGLFDEPAKAPAGDAAAQATGAVAAPAAAGASAAAPLPAAATLPAAPAGSRPDGAATR